MILGDTLGILGRYSCDADVYTYAILGGEVRHREPVEAPSVGAGPAEALSSKRSSPNLRLMSG
jgi:hypothetical protein